MSQAETFRAAGEAPGIEGLDKLYPGGSYFDPLGLADDPDTFAGERGHESHVSPPPSTTTTKPVVEGTWAEWEVVGSRMTFVTTFHAVQS